MTILREALIEMRA